MRGLVRTAEVQAAILIVCVALAWVLEIVDQVVFGESLDRFGIRPRDVSALWGILVAPLLHGGWAHLATNTVPFVVLAWLVMLRRVRDFFIVTALVIVGGGLGVWLIAAPNTVHIGASGVIFGYVGYLLARGYFERSLWSVLVALVVAGVYGGALFGLLPGQPGVSWEGHLTGFVSGVGSGKLLANRVHKAG
ncbi:MAG TPA: rhomboid family intramembrane serine protease [Chloroflexota bacterium]|nr:rhomboid family intramembrane serine protease [Chloroflexota bacterium]